MLDVVRSVFNTFGATVFVPIMLFIVAKMMGVKTQKAFDCGILAAVGLTGFTFVINSYSAVITPVVERMVTNAGINLSIVDIGWQATSVVAYSTEIGILFFAIAIILQLVLYFTKFTNVFMVSDLWNNYGFMVWGSMLYILTGNLYLSFLLMIVQNLYTLLFAEVLAPRFSKYYKYPNCCMTVPMHCEAVPFANELGKLESWGAIATCAISTAAIMAIFPKIAGIFASAFTPLSAAYSKKAAASGKGRKWFIAVNDAVAYGETATLVTGIILMPIILVVSFILPGNKFLPLVDLCALPYMIEVFICVTDGNMAKSIVCGAIWYTFGLLCVTLVAPYFTEVAASVGVEMAMAGTLVASFGVMARPLNCLSFLAFLSMNPLLIGGVIVLYIILYVANRKKGSVLEEYMETCNKLPEMEEV